MLSRNAKFWVAFAFASVIAIGNALYDALTDGVVTSQEIVTMVLAFSGAALVWLVPNAQNVDVEERVIEYTREDV